MKVLVVEDDAKIAHYLKKGLMQNYMVVDVAHDGEEGLDLASSGEYEVVILDIMLPKLDGMAVCKALRDEGVRTPILMLTARGLLDDKVAGFASGADDYLVKPFAFVELLVRVKALGRRVAPTCETVLRVGDLTLDTNAYEVKRGGVPITLSRKEFALLEYLMRNKGKILSKEQIIEQVWSYESEVLPNTAQVYIGYLRNKIDKVFSGKPELITTVRGFGYKIDG